MIHEPIGKRNMVPDNMRVLLLKREVSSSTHERIQVALPIARIVELRGIIVLSNGLRVLARISVDFRFIRFTRFTATNRKSGLRAGKYFSQPSSYTCNAPCAILAREHVGLAETIWLLHLSHKSLHFSNLYETRPVSVMNRSDWVHVPRS